MFEQGGGQRDAWMGGVRLAIRIRQFRQAALFCQDGVRPLLTQFEGAPVGLGLKQLSVGATLAGSFVNCGTRAPNGSFVNHQQLFGGVCKTRGLRTTSNVSFPLSSSSPLPGFSFGAGIYPAENTSVFLQGRGVLGEIRNVCLMQLLYEVDNTYFRLYLLLSALWPVLCIFNQQPDHFLWKG